MDYRNRRYYLVKMHQKNDISLRDRIDDLTSLKQSPPYNHFKGGKDYDGANVKGCVPYNMMLSCNIEDSEALEHGLRKIFRRDRYGCFMELTKEKCGQ